MMFRFNFLSAGLVALILVVVIRAEAEEAPKRGFLGLQYAYEETTGSSPEGRFRVRDLYPDGPAEKAGLQTDDLIVAVNGVTFRFDDELDIYRAFSWVEPGAEVELSILRDGSPLEVTLVAASEPSAIAKARPAAERQARVYRGQKTLYQLAEGDGVEVTVIREKDGFRGEIEGVDPEIRQDIAEFVGSRYLGIFGSRIQEGDRIKMYFQARPPEPGADPDARRLPAIRILEAPPHIWKKDPEDAAPKEAPDEEAPVEDSQP